uniref:BZIP domain-containing protein n=1 Tax=Chlamydomonas euryale TaxID=1486919 RepID=A0A7R9YWF4_9CHLO
MSGSGSGAGAVVGGASDCAMNSGCDRKRSFGMSESSQSHSEWMALKDRHEVVGGRAVHDELDAETKQGESRVPEPAIDRAAPAGAPRHRPERAAAVRARREVGEYIRATTGSGLLATSRSMPEPEWRASPKTPAGAKHAPRVGSSDRAAFGVGGHFGMAAGECGTSAKRRQTGDVEHAVQRSQAGGNAAASGRGSPELLPVDMAEEESTLEQTLSLPVTAEELQDGSLTDVGGSLMKCVHKKGKGGRNPAGDARLDPSIDPKKAMRIMANRLSAARSKLRQKLVTEGQRVKVEMLQSQKEKILEELERLTVACQKLEAFNDARVRAIETGNPLDVKASEECDVWQPAMESRPQQRRPMPSGHIVTSGGGAHGVGQLKPVGSAPLPRLAAPAAQAAPHTLHPTHSLPMATHCGKSMTPAGGWSTSVRYPPHSLQRPHMRHTMDAGVMFSTPKGISMMSPLSAGFTSLDIESNLPAS